MIFLTLKNRSRGGALTTLLLLLAPLAAPGQTPQRATGAEVVDKMVAVINGRELITYSDLLWQVALQPDTPLDNPRPEDLNRALETLIDQRLIAEEAGRLPSVRPKDEEVQAAIAALVRRFPSQSAFQQRASRVGLTAEHLREIVSQRLETEKYIDFRFRSFTVVTPAEVEGYYRDVYVPRFRRLSPGRIVPKLEEASAEIEKALTEGKIESDIAKFLEDARSRAEIVILNQP